MDVDTVRRLALKYDEETELRRILLCADDRSGSTDTATSPVDRCRRFSSPLLAESEFVRRRNGDRVMVSFEIGDLRYDESVRNGELREGEIYFQVTYLDDLRLVPMLQPYVFIGRDLDEGDEQQVYFQDAASYAAGVRLDDAREGRDIGNAYIISGSPSDVHVMEFEEALKALIKCELRRREVAPLVKGS